MYQLLDPEIPVPTVPNSPPTHNVYTPVEAELNVTVLPLVT